MLKTMVGNIKVKNDIQTVVDAVRTVILPEAANRQCQNIAPAVVVLNSVLKVMLSFGGGKTKDPLHILKSELVVVRSGLNSLLETLVNLKVDVLGAESKCSEEHIVRTIESQSERILQKTKDVEDCLHQLDSLVE